MNYHNRKFRPVSNTDNAEVSEETVFHYQQFGSILTCEYKGKNILLGHLIGIVDSDGNINMSYHQINASNKMMTGRCLSTPEIMDDGRIRLYEKWQWTSGNKTEGSSILEEII